MTPESAQPPHLPTPESAQPPHLPAPPRYGSASLADLLPSVLGILRVPGARPALALPASTRVVVLLIDGLGSHQLAACPVEAPTLTALSQARAAVTLDAGFPATTPVSLTSFGTGVPPGRHGITGLFLRRSPVGPLLDTLHLPDDVDPHELQPRGTAFERAAAAGVAVSRVGPRAFDGVGLTEVALRGGAYLGADSVGERVATVAEALGRGERSLVYVYFGDLDSTGHRRGWRSGAWRAELTHVDRFVEQLMAALPPGVLLLVTADHGMVDIAPGDRWDLAHLPSLDAGVEVLAGDPRAVHVHTRAGAAPDVHAAWSETLGDRAWLLTRDQAIEAGWFGPVVDDCFRARIGDVVAAARADVAIVDSRVLPAPILTLVGLHGSITPAEQLVPLLVHETG